PAAMEPGPEIFGRDSQPLPDLLGAEAVELTKQEGVGESFGEFRETAAEDLPELARLDLAAWFTRPRRRRQLAAAPPVERGRPFVLPVGPESRPGVAVRAAKMVHDLVLQDPDQPGPLARAARELLASAERFEERFLYHVGRLVGSRDA